MSFVGFKDLVEEGDTVILYISAQSMYAIEVVCPIVNKNGDKVENVFQTTYGALKVKSLIGKRFGSKVELSRGWALILHPTCELWTVTLPHRTQIVYSTDASFIILGLDIGPGSTVIEAGTGSGSMSHALARCVGPTGHLYSFDFHESRSDTARAEFARHGLSSFVTVGHKDVCTNGFGEDLAGKANAVFLDLPHPWIAVPHAVAAMKMSGGRFCSFSPCIEQVQRTCQALSKEGFVEISTTEALQREFNVVTRTLPSLDYIDDSDKSVNSSTYNFVSSSYNKTSPGHTGYVTMATLPPVWFRSMCKQAQSQETNQDADQEEEMEQESEAVIGLAGMNDVSQDDLNTKTKQEVL